LHPNFSIFARFFVQNLMSILDRLAPLSDGFFHRIGIRTTQVKNGTIQLDPPPLVTKEGIEGTEGMAGELSGESVDTWTINLSLLQLEHTFGSSWRDRLTPHTVDWQVSEHNQPWIDCRVVGPATVSDGGRVQFKLVAIGFGIQ
jgi:hypothetical protein